MSEATSASHQKSDRHPFGELLAQYRARRPGLTQRHLAELAGYDQSILIRMSQGKKDLTGPSGRERIIRILEVLIDQSVIHTLDEANALLLAAQMPLLFELQPAEAKLIARLGNTSAGLRTRRTNLPALISSFIGRTSEIAQVRQLLEQARLVTLTGSGGAGKTRLAQRVAGDVLLLYPDGVWYVELAALNNGAAIAGAGILALGLVPSDQPALERLIEHLSERHVLLVLDNCEHLIDAVAEFAIAVLQACPRVTILATSREAFDMEGEIIWRVPPMHPDEAIQLFTVRAQAVLGRMNVNKHDASVAQICQRLDGMPLAIELAASRLQVMSLNDIASQLNDRFTLLAHGRRGALPRHQTLRAMIDWSYELLSEPVQAAFRRLGTFTGGWEIDLAESLFGKDTLLLLTQLVNKSLVIVDEAGRHTRYRYLETIREYALEKLREAGELATTQRRHAESIAELAERAEKPIRGPAQKQWLDRITRDLPNLEAALAWCFGSAGDTLMGCRIVSMLKIVWLSSPATLNAEQWVNAAIDTVTDDMPVRIRAALHNIHASLNTDVQFQDLLTEFEIARELYEEADDSIGIADATLQVALSRLGFDENDTEAWQMLRESIQLGDAAGDSIIANGARLNLAFWMQIAKRFDEAEALLREGIQRCRDQGDLTSLTQLLWGLAHLQAERMLFAEARIYFEESAQVAEQIQSPFDMISGLTCAAEIVRFMGNLRQSIELHEQVVAYARAHLSVKQQLYSILNLAKALNEAGEHSRARSLLIEITQDYVRRGGRSLIPYIFFFDAFGCVYSGCGDAMRAARIFGAADACLDAFKHRRWAHDVWAYAPYIAKAHATLGDEAYDAAHAEGYAMTLDQAIDEALRQN